MKKLYSLLIAMTLVFSVSCFLQDEEDEAVPVGDGTLNVTVTYDDTASTTIDFGNTCGGTPPACAGTQPGTGKLFVYLYDSKPTTYRNPTRKYYGSTSTNGGTVSITGIAQGSYYVLAFYDYFGSSNSTPPTNPDNQFDPYELYTDSKNPDATSITTVSISGDTKSISITLYDQWQLGTSGAWAP